MTALAEYLPLLNLLLLPALHTLAQLSGRLAALEAIQTDHGRRLALVEQPRQHPKARP